MKFKLLLCGLATVASMIPAAAFASSTQTTMVCKVNEVMTTSNRIHVRCAQSGWLSVVYFAVPTTNTAEANRFLKMALSAAEGAGSYSNLNGVLLVTYDYMDMSGAAFGCSTTDCRRPLTMTLPKAD